MEAICINNTTVTVDLSKVQINVPVQNPALWPFVHNVGLSFGFKNNRYMI